MNTELEVKNIDNTHPVELKRIQHKEIQDKIDGLNGKIKFSIVNFVFFLFIGMMVIINSEIVSYYFAIASGIISLIFLALTFIFIEHLKTEKIGQRMLDLFYKYYNL